MKILENLFKVKTIITLATTGLFIYLAVKEILPIETSSMVIGMVFTYLPFMIMPIYTSLEKIDPLLHEAALDLGMTDFKKFWKVIVPMSSKGIISGSIMVLLPCLSGFAIPKILGDGNILLIGNIIEQSFINMSYNQGSVLAIVILIIIMGSIIIINKVDKEGETLLWQMM